MRFPFCTAFVLALLAAGCTAHPDEASDASAWEEPAWMAEQEQQREQFVATLQACMDSAGWNVTVDGDAGFVEPFSDRDELDRAIADSNTCLAEQGIDPSTYETLTETELRTMYPYDVDTYECLVAQGIDMQERPPSVDTYVEQGLATLSDDNEETGWWPYGDPALLSITPDEAAALQQACPERWTFASL